MGNFYTDVIKKDSRFTSTNCIRDLDLLEPMTRTAVQSIIQDAAAQGIKLMVTETFRSPARQAQLFKTGATKLKSLGCHSFGIAADFCKIDANGKADWGGDWKFLRDLAVKHNMVSGVDWNLPSQKHTFIDSDHIQRIDLIDQPGLFDLSWYPDENYRPIVHPPAVIT